MTTLAARTPVLCIRHNIRLPPRLLKYVANELESVRGQAPADHAFESKKLLRGHSTLVCGQSVQMRSRRWPKAYGAGRPEAKLCHSGRGNK